MDSPNLSTGLFVPALLDPFSSHFSASFSVFLTLVDGRVSGMGERVNGVDGKISGVGFNY